MSADQRADGWPAAPSRRPAALRKLGTEGRKIWRALVGRYEFTEPELVLLAEFARTADLLARLREEQAVAPLTGGAKGDGRAAGPLLGGIRAGQGEVGPGG